MKRRISVRGLAVHDGKLLCVKLKPYNGSLSGAKDYWCLPGGGLEANESLLDGVRREMIEETGIEPQVGNLLYVQQFVADDTDYLEFFFEITNASDYVAIDLSATSHGQEEIAEVAFIDPAIENVKPEFLGSEDLVAQVASGRTALRNRLPA